MPDSRVFVSYSHDSKEHSDAVFELCRRLRGYGVDARMDRDEPFPAKGWIVWMREQLAEARHDDRARAAG